MEETNRYYLKEAYYLSLDAAFARLLNGDIYTPIRIIGKTPRKRKIFIDLERVRLVMLAQKDREREMGEKNRTATASVAHDLKTPLAVIQGYAECIQDGIADKDYPSLIQSKVTEMSELVLSLVDTAREESSSREYMEKIPARTALRAALEKCRPYAKQKKITYKIGNIPNVALRADMGKLERVFQNIVTNAVKYTPEGGAIKVYFHRGRKYLKITVADNGSGIAKDVLPLIFDKFYTEDKSRGSANKGLGLYICKEIIERHGGSVDVSSKKGKGSKFIIKLPIEKDAALKGPTYGIDRLPKASKFALFFFTGWILCSVYRFMKCAHTLRYSTLFGAFSATYLFFFFWIIDLCSILSTGEIKFLSD